MLCSCWIRTLEGRVIEALKVNLYTHHVMGKGHSDVLDPSWMLSRIGTQHFSQGLYLVDLIVDKHHVSSYLSHCMII